MTAAELSPPIGSDAAALGDELLGADKLLNGLAGVVAGVIVEQKATSTNTLAKEQERSTLPLLVACENQTGGRGRMGRSWYSSGSRCLTFTMVFKLDQDEQHGLSLAMANGIAAGLGKNGFGVGLKWPNDLLDKRGRKLGGVLVEIAGSQRRAIVGVGINLRNQTGLLEHAPQAGWLFDQAKPMERNALLIELARAIASAFSDWRRNGWSGIRSEWLKRCVHSPGDELWVSLADGAKKRVFFAGIGERGQLLAKDADGHMREFDSGEISDAGRD